MSANQIFLPVLVQISLTMVVFIAMNFVKLKALKNGQVDMEKRALHADAWPEHVLKFTNNIANQFETPVLFYALCFVLWALKAVGPIALSLAWAFVLTRIAHAYVHTSSNYVPVRKKIFTLGCLCLLGMTALAFAAFF